MKDSRDIILKHLRSNSDCSEKAQTRIQERLDNGFKPRTRISTMSLSQSNRYKIFVEKVHAYNAQYSYCETQSEIFALITQFLKQHTLPHTLKIAPHTKLRNLFNQHNRTKITIEEGAAIDTDKTSISVAYGAIAENGAIMIPSCEEAPVSLNFLPENHIIILEYERIFTHYESILEALHEEKNSISQSFPRFINFIAGPSRSADIEQTLLLGAHGPQRVYIICCKETLQ